MQGASAAVVYTIGLALVVDTVGQDEMGAWIGFALSGTSFGILIGPFLGGVVYDRAGYNAVFVLQLGVIVVEFVLRSMMVEKKEAAKWMPELGKGADYGTFSNGRPESGSTASPDQDVGHDGIDGSANLANQSLGEDAVNDLGCNDWDKKSPSPLQAFAKEIKKWLYSLLKLLSSYRLAAALYGPWIYTSIFGGVESTLPIFMHRTFGWEATAAGSMFLAITIPHFASSFFGILSDRVGTRKVVLSGLLSSAVGLGLLASIRKNEIGYLVALGALLVLIGIFMIFLRQILSSEAWRSSCISGAIG